MNNKKKRILICCLMVMLALVILAVGIIMSVINQKQTQKEEENSEKQPESGSFLYGDKLFDASYVHTVDVLIDDWDKFVEEASEEEYVKGSIIIDGERFDRVAIRAKGNSSLREATKAGNGRYSLKIEFDHYIYGQKYYGLDKLNLNNLVSDATCVKDYLAYYLMNEMGVPASFCSYVFVTVNGNDLGLYIALEGVEESYLERNFGEDYGKILKPDDKHNQVEDTKTTPTAAATKTPEETPGPDAEKKDSTSKKEDRNSWLKEGQVELATLTYVDDNIDSYVVLFNSAKSKFNKNDKEKLIESLKKLNEQKNLEEAIDVDEVINYMTVQNFLVNYDGYIGTRVHNYYLYVNEDGVMSMLPWDYNLSFGNYGRSLTTSMVVNCPLDNPYGTELGSRPMFDWIVKSDVYKAQYYERTLYLVENYIENGKIEEEINRIYNMIYSYMQRDPTKWVTMESFEIGVNELKKIIDLRGKSLKLQVEGTVPATVAGQAADPDSLVPVGDLDIAKTGTSNSGGKKEGRENLP